MQLTGLRAGKLIYLVDLESLCLAFCVCFCFVLMITVLGFSAFTETMFNVVLFI